jgi:manganese transport protein
MAARPAAMKAAGRAIRIVSMNSIASDLGIGCVPRGREPAPARGLSGDATGAMGFVPVPTAHISCWRRLLSFAGPGYLVAVGYLDPGNWATSLAAGSAFGYSLLSVVLLASLMAMLLQAAALRLGAASGCDLAEACRRHFGPRVNLLLWLGCEVAVIACNLAEVLGMACGLQLLFGVPLSIGVCLTAGDVMLLLALRRLGVGPLECFIILLTAIIGGCLAVLLLWVHPAPQQLLAGFLPTSETLARRDMLYLAVGIIGATVMPHNLYLHSALVRSRRFERTERGLRQAIRYATLDSNIALTLALLVNVGILVLAAAAFHRPGLAPVTELGQAYRLLSPLLGAGAAGVLFGVALIASGLSSSITGTLAGQIVMEGFLDIHLTPAKRAMLTRSLAILPAVAAAAWFGSAGVGKLLILSQVVLGLQLPCAVLPLLWFTTRKAYLGSHAFGRTTGLALWVVAALIIALNFWVTYRLVA